LLLAWLPPPRTHWRIAARELWGVERGRRPEQPCVGRVGACVRHRERSVVASNDTVARPPAPLSRAGR
jgi:hypothetical protein